MSGSYGTIRIRTEDIHHPCTGCRVSLVLLGGGFHNLYTDASIPLMIQMESVLNSGHDTAVYGIGRD